MRLVSSIRTSFPAATSSSAWGTPSGQRIRTTSARVAGPSPSTTGCRGCPNEAESVVFSMTATVGPASAATRAATPSAFVRRLTDRSRRPLTTSRTARLPLPRFRRHSSPRDRDSVTKSDWPSPSMSAGSAASRSLLVGDEEGDEDGDEEGKANASATASSRPPRLISSTASPAFDSPTISVAPSRSMSTAAACMSGGEVTVAGCDSGRGDMTCGGSAADSMRMSNQPSRSASSTRPLVAGGAAAPAGRRSRNVPA